MIALVAVLRR